MVRDPLLASLRAWLVFLSLFELPEIHGFLLGDKSLADGFGSVSYTHLTLPTTPYV